MQHGASTLPEEFFDKFPEVETLEIHLATGFMNLYHGPPGLPGRPEAEHLRFLDVAAADERKADMTDAQFYYSSRKKAMGPFKPEMWGMDEESKTDLFQALEEKFQFFFDKLNVSGTRELIDQIVKPVEYHQPVPKVGARRR